MKYLVFHEPRSGGSLFIEMLTKENVIFDPETYDKANPKTVKDIQSYNYSLHSDHIIYINQSLYKMGLPPFIKCLMSEPDDSRIYYWTTRMNTIKQALSMYIARNTGIYSIQTDTDFSVYQEKIKNLSIPEKFYEDKEFLFCIHECLTTRTAFLEYFEKYNLNPIQIIYEKHLEHESLYNQLPIEIKNISYNIRLEDIKEYETLYIKVRDEITARSMTWDWTL